MRKSKARARTEKFVVEQLEVMRAAEQAPVMLHLGAINMITGFLSAPPAESTQPDSWRTQETAAARADMYAANEHNARYKKEQVEAALARRTIPVEVQSLISAFLPRPDVSGLRLGR